MGLTDNPFKGQTLPKETLNATRRTAASGNHTLLQTLDTLNQEVVLIDLKNAEKANAVLKSMQAQPAETD